MLYTWFSVFFFFFRAVVLCLLNVGGHWGQSVTRGNSLSSSFEAERLSPSDTSTAFSLSCRVLCRVWYGWYLGTKQKHYVFHRCFVEMSSYRTHHSYRNFITSRSSNPWNLQHSVEVLDRHRRTFHEYAFQCHYQHHTPTSSDSGIPTLNYSLPKVYIKIVIEN